MNISEIYQTPDHIIAGHIIGQHTDRKVSLEQLGKMLQCKSVFFVNQIHSGITVNTLFSQSGTDGDAIISCTQGELIGIFTADCVPVILYTEDSAGLIHAGWKGFKEHIFSSFFKKSELNHQSVSAIIGPCICHSCYEVGIEVASLFPNDCVNYKAKLPKLDLKKAAALELQRLGVEQSRISVSDQCTLCSPKHYHSYRRNQTPLRNISFVTLKSPFQSVKSLINDLNS